MAFVHDIEVGTQLRVLDNNIWQTVEVSKLHRTTDSYAVCNVVAVGPSTFSKKGHVFHEADYGVRWVYPDEGDSNSEDDSDSGSDAASEASEASDASDDDDVFDEQLALMITSAQKTLEAVQLMLNRRR